MKNIFALILLASWSVALVGSDAAAANPWEGTITFTPVIDSSTKFNTKCDLQTTNLKHAYAHARHQCPKDTEDKKIYVGITTVQRSVGFTDTATGLPFVHEYKQGGHLGFMGLGMLADLVKSYYGAATLEALNKIKPDCCWFGHSAEYKAPASLECEGVWIASPIVPALKELAKIKDPSTKIRIELDGSFNREDGTRETGGWKIECTLAEALLVAEAYVE